MIKTSDKNFDWHCLTFDGWKIFPTLFPKKAVSKKLNKNKK